MDKDSINNKSDNKSIVCKAASIVERLQDIQNVVQLFEVSLASNHDDESIIRSVLIISRMIDTLIEHECSELIHLCSDCENISQ